MSSILKDIRAAFGDVEPAPYTVVVQRGGFEERVYPARQWACTSMAGPSRHELVTPMFRRLFSYISGRNEPNVRMDMTTPVVTYVEPLQDEEEERRRRRMRSCCKGGGKGGGGDCGGEDACQCASITTTTTTASLTYTMSFLVPGSHQGTPPSTADKRIFFESRKKMAVLCRRFSGYLNDDVVRREMAALREAIKSNGDEQDVDFERYYVVGYDPPFKLLGRRNEIWVVKRVWEAEEEEVVKMEKGLCGGDFVMVEREEEEELVVVNGVVKAKEVTVEEENAEEKNAKVVEKKENLVETNANVVGEEENLVENNENEVGNTNAMNENNEVVVEASGVVGRENGEVVFVEEMNN